MSDLPALLAEHRAAPFPEGVEKGLACGEIEPVMIDADICGWAERATNVRGLPNDERQRLRQARDELRRSLDALPQSARPYFERLVSLADAALAT